MLERWRWGFRLTESSDDRNIQERGRFKRAVGARQLSGGTGAPRLRAFPFGGLGIDSQSTLKAQLCRMQDAIFWIPNGTKQWTMERIAEALNVVHSTIVKDLKEFVPSEQTFRPKGGQRR